GVLWPGPEAELSIAPDASEESCDSLVIALASRPTANPARAAPARKTPGRRRANVRTSSATPSRPRWSRKSAVLCPLSAIRRTTPRTGESVSALSAMSARSSDHSRTSSATRWAWVRVSSSIRSRIFAVASLSWARDSPTTSRACSFAVVATSPADCRACPAASAAFSFAWPDRPPDPGARSHMPLPPPLRLGSVRLPVFAATHSPYGHACRPRNGSVRRRDRPRLVGPEGASGGGNGASRRGGGGPGRRVEYRCRPPRRYQGSMSAFSPRLRERGRARARGPLADRDFLLLLAATLGMFANHAPMLSVVPLWAAEGGSAHSGVGTTTAVTMATTVAIQLCMGRLLRRFGPYRLLVVGALLLGVPTFGYPLSTDLGWVLSVSAVRGLGFGIVTVAGSALVADLTTPAQRGRAVGWHGIAVGLPQVVLLPLGVWFAESFGFTAVFLAAGASSALVPLLVAGMRRRRAGG